MENRWSIVLLAFLAGSFAGGIAKLIVYRAPTELPLLKGSFKCPECRRDLSVKDRIPLLAYLLGRGRRQCGHIISVRDPLIELIVGASWALSVSLLGQRPELPAFLAFMATLVTLSAIDLEHRRIPNRVLGPMAILAIALLSGAAIFDDRLEVLWGAVLGGLVYFVPMLLLALIIPSSMGMGDVKLAGYLGMHLGWFSLKHVLVGAFLGFLIGALIGVGLMIVGKKGRKDYVPFGPSMALGGALTVLLGTSVPGGLVG